MSAEYTTVPISLWDGTKANTDIFARATFIFNAQLSFEKLHQTWIQMLQARPIMQARVRRSKTAASGLEYHVYTPEGLARYLQKQSTAPDHLKDFFCLDQSKRSITEYSPAISTSPPSERGIFVADAPDPEDQQRCTTFNGVETMDTLLTSDRPVMTIQVTRFSDATLITFSFNHLMGDLFTIPDILNGWEDALNGRPTEPWEKLEVDPFAEYGPGGKLASKDVESSNPALPPGWRMLGVIDKARLVSRVLWDMHYKRPEKTISQKYVFLPNAEVDRLVEEAKRDLIALEERRRQQGVASNSSAPPSSAARMSYTLGS
ncbi:uncharacterized protein N7529_001572 [Penicillium soppii]|uniref:uncharacterized protein n=1 Tax=Penicillium soppii TaxID=69789 RepID=UPI002547703E|nr:uncharacterized protein N7529_001572 [Penicillium soppii]KAJ5875988.1 hypothetical protein N7529_001572 [Penicillium soppii]